jgi:hypothetical protein
MSQDSTLVERIAAKAGCSSETAEQVLSDFGLNLKAGGRRHRSLRLDRLRVRGDKAGEVEPGGFDETFTFGLGVSVISAGNLRGKTSILEVLTLILRGELRNLQADVLSWLAEISLDVHVNGQPVGFRLSLEKSQITRGLILAGTVAELADSDDAPARGTTELACAQGGDEWAGQVGEFMMSRLALEEMQVFNRARNDDEAGTIKSHGWPAYYSALFPPSGADTVLLGSTSADFLPVRLMQVFLDMPEATRSMRASALAKRLDSEQSAEQRRGKDAAAALAGQLSAAEERQAAAALRLAEVNAEAPSESLRELGGLAVEAAARLGRAHRDAADAEGAFSVARLARAADEKALNALRETAAASALFHGLDPQFCPRCETPIDSQRRLREHESRQCAVCDTSLHEEEADDHAERLQAATDALAATRAAERALDATVSRANAELDDARLELAAVNQRLERAQAARQATARIEAEQDMATAAAVVEALRAIQPEEAGPSTAQMVLTAADQVLHDEIRQASGDLYGQLGAAARDLAISFGISELEGVRVKANGNMDVTKGGGATSSFSAQSPGERLRLRYALLIALLRTARARGIAGHPGLLLLDSLKAEEVQDDHAQTLLQGLVAAAADEPGLQILVTTADQALPRGVSGVAAIITPKAGRTALF